MAIMYARLNEFFDIHKSHAFSSSANALRFRDLRYALLRDAPEPTG
jgi:hypothetical protein